MGFATAATGIVSSEIVDSTILNVDINASAAISLSKLSTAAGENLGVGTSTVGTNGTDVISINADGTVPSSSPAGIVQIFANDTAAGATTATLAIRTEEAVVEEAISAGTHSLNVWINGTEYHLLLASI